MWHKKIIFPKTNSPMNQHYIFFDWSIFWHLRVEKLLFNHWKMGPNVCGSKFSSEQELTISTTTIKIAFFIPLCHIIFKLHLDSLLFILCDTFCLLFLNILYKNSRNSMIWNIYFIKSTSYRNLKEKKLHLPTIEQWFEIL